MAQTPKIKLDVELGEGVKRLIGIGETALGVARGQVESEKNKKLTEERDTWQMRAEEAEELLGEARGQIHELGRQLSEAQKSASGLREDLRQERLRAANFPPGSSQKDRVDEAERLLRDAQAQQREDLRRLQDTRTELVAVKDELNRVRNLAHDHVSEGSVLRKQNFDLEMKVKQLQGSLEGHEGTIRRLRSRIVELEQQTGTVDPHEGVQKSRSSLSSAEGDLPFDRMGD